MLTIVGISCLLPDYFCNVVCCRLCATPPFYRISSNDCFLFINHHAFLLRFHSIKWTILHITTNKNKMTTIIVKEQNWNFPFSCMKRSNRLTFKDSFLLSFVEYTNCLFYPTTSVSSSVSKDMDSITHIWRLASANSATKRRTRIVRSVSRLKL